MRQSEKSPYQVGPYFLTLRNGFWHIHGRGSDGRRVRFSTHEADLMRAKTKIDEFVRETESGWRMLAGAPSWRKIASVLHSRKRQLAKKRSIPFLITAGDVYRLMEECGFRCAITGIEFSPNPVGERDPWAPSIDRIENRQGYLPDNVRVVCLAVNLALSDFGYDILLRLSKAVVRNALPRPEEPLFQTRFDTEPTFDDAKSLLPQ